MAESSATTSSVRVLVRGGPMIIRPAALTHAEIGRAHRFDDVVRNPLPADGAEGRGQASDDRAAMAAVEGAV